MNIRNFYDKVKQYALNTQTVESFYELSPYETWNSLNINYGSFNCNINYIRRTGNLDIVNCTLYYGNKLLNDSSNVFQVQSDGYNAIINVINHRRLRGHSGLSIFPAVFRHSRRCLCRLEHLRSC